MKSTIENSDTLNQTQETFDRNSKVVSNMECTGLSPGTVLDDSESASYRELYDIYPPKAHDNPGKLHETRPTERH
jgi:hypothetical protein